MVVNEATSSVQAKGTKTVIAAAVTALMAGGAMAALPSDGVIDNKDFPTNLVTGQQTNKLISGEGKDVVIHTNGSIDALASKVSVALKNPDISDKLTGLLGALGATEKDAVIAGVTGGHNLMDKDSAATLVGVFAAIESIKQSEQPKGQEFCQKLFGQFNYKIDEYAGSAKVSGGYFNDSDNLVFKHDKDTHITVGDTEGTSNPLVIGVVGGDTFVSINNANATINQNGSTHLNFDSGNTAGVSAGSFIVNTVFNDNGKYGTVSASVDQTILNISNTANVGLFTGGGVAVGLSGANASSTVKNGTEININIKDSDDPLNGLVIGGLGGGLAVATGTNKVQGHADVDAGSKTVINVNNGNVLGLLGGGGAVSFDVQVYKPSDVQTSTDFDEMIKNIAMAYAQQMIGTGAGAATSKSGDIEINLGEKSDTAAVAGGGVAFADASYAHSAASTAVANSVTMNFAGHELTDGEKNQVHTASAAFIGKLQEWKKGGLENIAFSDVKSALAALSKGVNVDGVHIGNLGGGIGIARGCYESPNAGSTVASSKVGTVEMNFQSGYNVATAAGGLAIAMDTVGSAATNDDGKSLQISSVSDVDEVKLNISGGENILVTAGGMSYATAENGAKSLVNAMATVDKATVMVTGGSVDGLFGGGIAIDDTNQSATNASTKTDTVHIELGEKGKSCQGCTINKANVDPILSLEMVAPTKPGNRAYLYHTAYVVGKDAQAAIVGGGFATGGGALADVGTVEILLNDGTVDGNVFAGGVATLQGKSTVTNATVQVDGATVKGNIYGGGIAGASKNKIENYEGGTATVGTSTINLLNGKLDGSVYVGGQAFEDENIDMSAPTFCRFL